MFSFTRIFFYASFRAFDEAQNQENKGIIQFSVAVRGSRTYVLKFPSYRCLLLLTQVYREEPNCNRLCACMKGPWCMYGSTCSVLYNFTRPFYKVTGYCCSWCLPF